MLYFSSKRPPRARSSTNPEGLVIDKMRHAEVPHCGCNLRDGSNFLPLQVAVLNKRTPEQVLRSLAAEYPQALTAAIPDTCLLALAFAGGGDTMVQYLRTVAAEHAGVVLEEY